MISEERTMRASKFWKICLVLLPWGLLAIYVTMYLPKYRATSESTRKLAQEIKITPLTGSGKPGDPRGETHSPVTASNNGSKAKTEQQKPRTKLLCMSFSGRLGNQLFQYASAIGLAKKLNRIPAFEAGSELNSALQHPPPLSPIPPEHRQRCRVAKRQGEKNAYCCKFHKEFVELDPNHDYAIGQYLQSWRYFEGYDDEVKRAMQFKDAVRAEADKKLAELRRQHANRTLVGIHIRRGDYLRDLHLRMGYRTAPPDYFTRAMDFMRRRFGNVTFFVSADDAGKTWFNSSVPLPSSSTSSSSSPKSATNASLPSGETKNKTSFSGGGSSPVSSAGGIDVVMLNRGSVAGDMALLASLDHAIISVGTYSWWVGYLNRGVTVYWKDFIVPGTEIGNQFLPKGETYVYPNWVPL